MGKSRKPNNIYVATLISVKKTVKFVSRQIYIERNFNQTQPLFKSIKQLFNNSPLIRAYIPETIHN